MAFAGKQLSFQGPSDDRLINQIACTNLEHYEKLFSGATTSAIGDGSVSSLYYYRDAIENIKRYTPGAKLIVILRNPIQRA